MSYYILSDLDGEQIGARKIDGAPVDARDRWLRATAALADLAAVGEGQRFRAVVSAGEIYSYFPPPSWLERMLLLGRPRPRRRGALRVDALAGALPMVTEAMRTLLFVKIAAG